MREVRRKKGSGRRAGFLGRQEDQEKEEVNRLMVYCGCPRSEWDLKEEQEVGAPLFSPPPSHCHLFQPIMSPHSRKEVWLRLAWFTWETPSRFWEIPSRFWETPSCTEEGGQAEPLQVEVEGRNRARCQLNSTQEEEEEEGVEVEEDRRGKEELLKKSPNPCYGGAEEVVSFVRTV